MYRGIYNFVAMKKMEEKYKILENTRNEALKGGGDQRILMQHQKGKLTARERLMYLLDDGSFQELGQTVTHRSYEFGLEKNKVLGDGVITGYGKISGRTIYVYSQDFTVLIIVLTFAQGIL